MAAVSFSEVRKSFGRTPVVHGVSLDIADGEFVVLVGPSGCGKSTLLRMLAGLEDITGGTIAIDGRVVNDLDSKDRDIAMVFQSYALYPHMTVRRQHGFLAPPPRREARPHRRACGPGRKGFFYMMNRCPTWTPSCASPCAPRSRRCTSG